MWNEPKCAVVWTLTSLSMFFQSLSLPGSPRLLSHIQEEPVCPSLRVALHPSPPPWISRLAALGLCRDGPPTTRSTPRARLQDMESEASLCCSLFTEAVVGKVCHFQRSCWQVDNPNRLILLPWLLRENNATPPPSSPVASMRIKGSLAYFPASAGVALCSEAGSVFRPSQGIISGLQDQQGCKGHTDRQHTWDQASGPKGRPWPRVQALLQCLPPFPFIFLHCSQKYSLLSICPLPPTATTAVMLLSFMETHSFIHSTSFYWMLVQCQIQLQ